MTRERSEGYASPSAFLPPRELWVHDPTKDEPIPTPLDERGLVDMPALIGLMKSTVAPDYDWKSPFVDVHHLQWPDRWYPRDDDLEGMPHVFRNLAISKVAVPRIFHNWVHRVTEPPAMPSEEVMHYRIDAQRVALSLFRQVRHSKTTARRKGLDETGFEQLLTERFDTFAATFEEAKQAPKPFQLLKYDNYELRTTQDMVRIGTRLGKFAVVASATSRVKRVA